MIEVRHSLPSNGASGRDGGGRLPSPLRPDPRFTSSAQDNFVVVLRTNDGLEGIGESGVNPWSAKACLKAPGTHTILGPSGSGRTPCSWQATC